MGKLWLVARHEYLKQVRRRSFWLVTLGLPLLIAAVITVGIVVSIGKTDDRPLGYVDRAGVLAAGLLPEGESVAMRSFPDEAAATAALERGDIQAFYVLPANYLESPEVTIHYWEDWPGESARDDFDAFLRVNLAGSVQDGLRQRVLEGMNLVVRSADGQREMSEQSFMQFVIPLVMAIFFFFAVMASGGYLLEAVTDEKENRTVEVIFTSLTPEQLMIGKAVGLVSLVLSQLSVWVMTAAVGVIVGAQFLEPLQNIQVPWIFLLVAALYFLPSYVLIAGMMMTIGSMVTETRQGQQISGVLNMLFVLPFFFMTLVFFNPDSPILVALTLFPTTAFLTVMLRWGATAIPVWQLIGGWGLLVLTAGLSVWASARIFRVSMLSYGQRITLRGLAHVLRLGV
ncbi:MAG: ABC transporter permease [Chloroflexota bacterium]